MIEPADRRRSGPKQVDPGRAEFRASVREAVAVMMARS
jgi:hypothetical protein